MLFILLRRKTKDSDDVDEYFWKDRRHLPQRDRGSFRSLQSSMSSIKNDEVSCEIKTFLYFSLFSIFFLLNFI